MTWELYLLLTDLFYGISVLIVLMSFIRYRERDIKTKLIGLTFVCSLMAYYSLAIFDLRGMEVNMPLNIFAICNFIILTVVYYYAVNKRYKAFFFAVGMAYAIFGVLNILFWQRTNTNTYTITLSSFLTLTYCILYWYRLLVELPEQQLHRVPMFWFNSAFLIYYAGCLFFFLFSSYLMQVLYDSLLIYSIFLNILAVVQELVIMFGLWQDLRNIKSRSSLPLAL